MCIIWVYDDGRVNKGDKKVLETQDGCRLLKKECPVFCAGMEKERYTKAGQYFLENGLVFSHNGGKTFNKTVHILRLQCAAWAEYAWGSRKVNTNTNILSWKEKEITQHILDTLWKELNHKP